MISWNHSKKQPMPRIAVVGTGTMGSAMAVRLLDAGMEVSIWVTSSGIDDAACRSWCNRLREARRRCPGRRRRDHHAADGQGDGGRHA